MTTWTAEEVAMEFQGYLNSRGRWYDFKKWAEEEMGFNLEDLGFETEDDDEDDEDDE